MKSQYFWSFTTAFKILLVLKAQKERKLYNKSWQDTDSLVWFTSLEDYTINAAQSAF